MLASTAWGQETDPAKQIAEQWRVEQAQHDARQARLDELISVMAREMETIRNTEDQSKRQALMATHRNNIREAMDLMREMGGVHMRDVLAEHLGPGAASDANAEHNHTMPARPRDHMSDSRRLADLENRVDMLQVMMESAMEAQARN
jgi:hypothetical protein